MNFMRKAARQSDSYVKVPLNLYLLLLQCTQIFYISLAPLHIIEVNCKTMERI